MGMTPAVSLTAQSLEPVQAYADNVATSVITNATLSSTVEGLLGAYNGSTGYTLPTKDTFSLTPAEGESLAASDYTITGITWTYTAVGSDQASNFNETTAVNAGTYTATAAISYTDDTSTAQTATKKAEFTIAQAALSITAPTSITEGSTLEVAANGFEVGGVQGSEENVYTKTASIKDDPSATTVSLGSTVVCTLALGTGAAGNYSLPNPATAECSNIVAATPAADITIAGVGYDVAFAPTGAINELNPAVAEDNVSNFTYSYDAQAQSPIVTVQYTDSKGAIQTPAQGSYQVVYALVTNGVPAQGSTDVPTNPGTYQVTVEEVGAATPNTFTVGEFVITPADINNPKQVLITWNGEQVNGGGTTAVTMNNINQWKSALKITYPATQEAVSEAQYSITNGDAANSLKITPAPSTPSFSSYLTDGTQDGSAPVVITYTMANYAIASVAVNTQWLTANAAEVTYDGDQITLPAEALDVTANGRALPQYTVFKNGEETDLVASQVAADANGTLAPNATLTVPAGKTTPEGTYTVTKNWNLSFGANVNAGTGTVTVTGTGNYAGEQTAQFTIAPFNISKLTDDQIQVVIDKSNPITFNNQEQTPDVKVVSGPGIPSAGDVVSAENNKSKKFTVAYKDNVNATTDTSLASVTVTPTDPNYTGTKVLTFAIAKYNLSADNGSSTTNPNIAFVPTGANYEAQNPTVVSGLKNKDESPVVMTAGTDYKIFQNTNGQNTTSLGAITIAANDLDQNGQKKIQYTIQGQGNYTGEIFGTYYVTKNNISEYIESATAPVNVQYDGTAQEPEFTIKLKGGTTISSTAAAANGLVVTYGNNKNASSSATITIAAAGSVTDGKAYYGTYPTYNWTIEAADLSNATFGIILPEKETAFQYSGSQIKPSVAIADPDSDDYVAPKLYNKDAKAGYIVTAKGTEILLDNIKDEYTISYGANTDVTNAAKTNAGTVTITATSSNLKNAATEKFDIVAAPIAATASLTGPMKVQADGSTYAEPTVTVTSGKKTLVRGKDYTLTVSPNQEVGVAATWTVKGMGNYTGIVNGTFTPVNDIAQATIVMPTETYTYDGTEKKPVPVITTKSGNATTTLENGKNYTVTYKNNINAGTATVIITGVYTAEDKANDIAASYWGGTVEKTFTIAQAEGTLAVDAVAAATYTGSAITPEPDFTFTVGTTEYAKADLEAGVDYKYVYANNINSKAVSGKNATVTVQMIGNYGAKDGAVEFEIAQADVANATAIVGDVVVGGTPKVAVSMGDVALKEGTDYTFAADTKTPGTKTATITGKGNYTGTQKVTFVVLKENQVLPGDTDLTGGTWAKVDGKWQYTTKDDKLVSSGWAEINNKWYYFDSKGNAQTGWLELNGTWYYLNKAGEGTECAMVSNAWKKINGNWYHFAKNGAMQTGWQKINGAWYYLNKKGEGTEGAMRTGWQKINGAWYYLNKAGQGTEGAMKTGWFNDNGTWYYLLRAGEGTEGKMVSNQWMQINGSWFYFYAGGAMAANTWVGNYYVDANGYWVR